MGVIDRLAEIDMELQRKCGFDQGMVKIVVTDRAFWALVKEAEVYTCQTDGENLRNVEIQTWMSGRLVRVVREKDDGQVRGVRVGDRDEAEGEASGDPEV